MSDGSLAAVVAAARTLLPELSTLLGVEADGVRHELEELIDRAERGEPVADQIMTLLRSRPATRDRVMTLLATGPQDTAAAAATVSPPPSSPPPPPSAPPPSAPPPRRTRWRRRGQRAKPSRREDVAARGGDFAQAPEATPRPAEAAARPADDDAAPVGAAPEEELIAANGDRSGDAPRWILSQVWDLADPAAPRRMKRAFHAGSRHTIKVRIGPIDDEWFVAEGSSVDESVGARLPGGVEHTLAVIFFVPAFGVKERKVVVLPATGPSDVVTFSLPPFADRAPVEAWISLVFEGRHIQSARLSGFALDDPDSALDEAAMSLQWAAISPGLADPGVREPFDASVWLDARAEGDAGVSGVGVPDADDIIAIDDVHLDTVLNDIRALLRGLVDAPASFDDLTSDASVGLLRSLAFQGRILHELIGEPLEETMPGRALERIQIVQTDRIDFAPLEFLYDLPTPSEDAGLCEGWKDQVIAGVGRCPDANHPPGALPRQVTKVCPLGFWGLSRVIERQIIEARDVRSEGIAVRVAPTNAQPQLAPLGSALFGFSTRVDATVGGQSTAVLDTLKDVTGGHALSVDTWGAWATAVAGRPSLLVLLSHTVEHQSVTALEIGPEVGGSRIKLIELVPEFVKIEPADTPVVLLLGCDTAVERNEFRSFVGQFLDCGAALVVGTITPVLGERVSPVTQSLIREIASALTAGGRPLGIRQ